MATISDILIRMKELAVQASSGQFSSIERSILDSEFQALSSEITRISNDPEFNGSLLIAGSGDCVTDQLATTGELATQGFAITYDTNVTTSGDAYRLSYDYTAATSQQLSLTNVNTGDRVTVDIEAAIDAVLAARATPGTPSTGNLVAGESVDVVFTSLGITVTVDNNFNRTADQITEGALAFDASSTLTITTADVTFNNSGLTNTGLTELLAVGTYAAATGLLTLNVASSGSGDATFAATAGLEFSLNGGAYGATTADFDAATVQTVSVRLATSQDVLGTMTFTNVERTGATDTLVIDIGNLAFGQSTVVGGTNTSFTFKVGTGNQTYDSLTFTVNASSASALGVLGTAQSGLIGITTINLAETASTAISAAIDTLNQSRSDIGAAQNRLAFAANNLATAIENAEAARSSLLDLDVAAEITVFTSKQILIQTGVSMLAQANQLPQNLLRLFQ